MNIIQIAIGIIGCIIALGGLYFTVQIIYSPSTSYIEEKKYDKKLFIAIYAMPVGIAIAIYGFGS